MIDDPVAVAVVILNVKSTLRCGAVMACAIQSYVKMTIFEKKFHFENKQKIRGMYGAKVFHRISRWLVMIAFANRLCCVCLM